MGLSVKATCSLSGVRSFASELHLPSCHTVPYRTVPCIAPIARESARDTRDVLSSSCTVLCHDATMQRVDGPLRRACRSQAGHARESAEPMRRAVLPRPVCNTEKNEQERPIHPSAHDNDVTCATVECGGSLVYHRRRRVNK